MGLEQQQSQARGLNLPLFRLAPTPNGYLHRGNAYSFLLTMINAKRLNGQVLLRIDDLDPERVKPIFIEDIFEILNWLGISWSWGPQNSKEAMGDFSQLRRMMSLLKSFWEIYESNPSKFYVCDCTKKQIAERNASLKHDSSIYDGHCRDRGLAFVQGQGMCVRFNSGESSIDLGDFIVLRSLGTLSYQWISLVDDLGWGVSHIVRGSDLINSTQAQKELALIFSEKGKCFTNAQFLHHAVLLADDGEKISKNREDQSLKLEIDGGLSLEDLYSDFFEWISSGTRVVFPTKANLDDLYAACEKYKVFQDENFFFKGFEA